MMSKIIVLILWERQNISAPMASDVKTAATIALAYAVYKRNSYPLRAIYHHW
ncbi:hypothetical protein BH10PSE6_BH10PSE6_28520 [soil metagenome]